MDQSRSRPDLEDVARALLFLGGRGTLGDIVLATGLPCADGASALEELIARDQVHVTVSESAVVTYRLDEDRRPVAPSSRPPVRSFDLKTLRLIRARGGVISLAEFVEHTGLPLQDAAKEVWRLAALYGGEAHPSLDGHTVYAFPQLVISAHGPFSVREPRPAWVRARDPMRPLAMRGSRGIFRLGIAATGLVGALGVAAAALLGLGLGIGGVALAAAGAGALLCGREVLRVVRTTPRFRFEDEATLRRYALGLVFETALKGKGVVSLERTRTYLQARAGRRFVRRSTVERALRSLAQEFDAPITELNGDLFFGFRNVKRQFLASHLQRNLLQLERRPSGRTLFDSGDSPVAAGERELEAFDRALNEKRLLPLR